MNELMFYDLRDSQGLVPSLASQVAREVGRRIIARSYSPGDLIEDENALADRYHVSRSVVRDAVKILVGKGLLEVRRGIGTRVRDRSRWGFLDDDVLAWHQSAPASPDFLRQLLDVRLMIEPKAARWAAERGTSLQHDAIVEAVERMARETGSVEEFVFADAAFHRAVLHAANNEILWSFEGAIISALLGSIRLTNRDPRENEESIPLHRAVADEIISRDATAAEKKMEVLLSDVRAKLEIHIDSASGMKPT